MSSNPGALAATPAQAQAVMTVLERFCEQLRQLPVAELFGEAATAASCDLVLSGPDSAIYSHILSASDTVRLFWNQPNSHTLLLDIYPDKVVDFRSGSDQPLASRELVDRLLSQLPHMYVVPPVEVPYGIAVGSRLEAVVFTTDVNVQSDRASRVALGQNQDLYALPESSLLDDFRAVASEAAWMELFWQYHRAGRVVRLSDRLTGDSGLIAVGASDAVTATWLEFEGHDNQTPGLVTGVRYLAWHTSRQCWDGGRGSYPVRHQLEGFFV